MFQVYKTQELFPCFPLFWRGSIKLLLYAGKTYSVLLKGVIEEVEGIFQAPAQSVKFPDGNRIEMAQVEVY